MILWILVFVGILMLATGIYLLVVNYRHGKYIKGYGLLSYVGFGMVLLGGILLMEPIFKSLPGNFANTEPWGIAMFASIIASKLLLQPTFLKSKNDEIEFISELSNIRGEQNLKQNIQVDIIEQTVKNEGIDITQKTQPHKEMKLFYEQSPPNNSTLSFSLKERIALINNHFLMGGNEGNENNQQIIDTEQLPNNNNQFTFINPLNDIMKPVSHLKKQKPTYKIFDENYSKSVEIDFQVQNSLQKTIAKAKNLRNVLKKKK